MSADRLIVDCDSHVWEPDAIWTDYLGERERLVAQDAFYVDTYDGRTVTTLNGHLVRNLNRSILNRHAVWTPGMSAKDVGDLDVTTEPVHGASVLGARLAVMDELGVDHQVVFPTLFAEHFPEVRSPLAAELLARAYNDWVADWSSPSDGRVLPAGVLPLQSIAASLRELDRLADKGFRAVALRPCWYNDRYLTLKEFAPLWAALEEREIVACIHPAAGSTNSERLSHGPFVERVAANLNIGHDVAHTVAPQLDNMLMVIALLNHGQLEDHPGLRLLFCHAGATWLELVLEKAETFLWTTAPMLPVTHEPERLWEERQILLTFDPWEEYVGETPEVFAAAAAWGSRYPQQDASGPAEALSMLRRGGSPDAAVTELMGANAARLFGIAQPAHAGTRSD